MITVGHFAPALGFHAALAYNPNFGVDQVSAAHKFGADVGLDAFLFWDGMRNAMFYAHVMGGYVAIDGQDGYRLRGEVVGNWVPLDIWIGRLGVYGNVGLSTISMNFSNKSHAGDLTGVILGAGVAFHW